MFTPDLQVCKERMSAAETYKPYDQNANQDTRLFSCCPVKTRCLHKTTSPSR